MGMSDVAGAEQYHFDPATYLTWLLLGTASRQAFLR
jgi:hypothetical protein